MKKKLLLAAISAAVSMPVWADVKVGGMAQVEIAREESTVGATSTELNTVEDNSRGRFWITADEDLGAGMKGLAHYEFRVDTTGVCELEAGGSTCTNDSNIREKYVGIQTGFGTLKLGSVRAPYKYAGGVLWDAFVTTNLEARGNGGMTGGVFGHNNFFDNGINYTSPTFFGVTISGAYVGDDVGPAGSTTSSGDSSAAVEWKGFGAHVVAAMAHNNEGANDVDNIKLGARYDIAAFGIMAQFENTENDAGTTDTDTIFLGLQGKFGPVTAALQAGKTEPATGADTDYAALGAFYNFSKTFSAFGGYRMTETGTTENEVLSVGLRKVF